MKIYKTLLTVIFLSFFSISCTELFSSSEISYGLRSELNDRGKTKLDPSNPYVAPNALLAEEAKTSESLKGFLGMKGNPTAISFHETFFGSPELSLFYDDKGESYQLKQNGKEWIISSPTKIEVSADKSDAEKPSLYREEPPVVTYMDPKLEEVRKKASDQKKDTNPEIALKQDSNKEVDTPNESKEFSDNYHVVEFEGQTLEFVAFWYTGSVEATDRIAGINGIKKATPLRLSQSIRIPAYMSTKEEKPTVEDLKSFLLRK